MAVTPGGFLPFGIQVLQDLAPRLASRASAFTLHVGDGYSERIVYACGSGLYVFSVGERSGAGIAGALIRALGLGENDFEEAQARARDTGISLRDVLVARGSISADEHDEIARRVVLDEVLDLVFWEDALHSTYEAPPPTEFFAADAHVGFADLAPGAIEEGIASWIRKWVAVKPILRGDDAALRLEPSGSRRASGSSDGLAKLLRACRRSATIRSLRRDTDLRLTEICDHAKSAIDSGFLSISTEGPPPPSARQSIEKLEKALPLALGKDLIRLKLASVHRRAGEPDKACAHLQIVADQAASRGDRSLAMDCLRSTLSIRPENAAALRSLVEIQAARGLLKEAVQAALQVESALLREKKAEPMRAVAEILGELGDTLAVREVNADLKAVGGRHEEALEEYRALADRHEAAQDFDRAVQALGKALQIDGEDEDLKTRLVQLKQRGRRSGAGAGPGMGSESSTASPAPARRLPLRSGAVILIAVAAVLAALLGTGRRPEVEADGEADLEITAPLDSDATPAEAPVEPAGAEPEVRSAPPAEPPPRRLPYSRPEAKPSAKPRALPPRPATASPKPEPRPSRKEPSVPLAVTRGAAPKPPPGSAGSATPRALPGVPFEAASGARPERKDDAGAPGPLSRPSGTPEKPSAQEPRTLPPADLFADAVPPRPCESHGVHRTFVRALPSGRRILYADACFLRIEDAATGDLLLECGGEEGTRWAHDAAGQVICRWSPGKPLQGVCVDPDEEWLPEGWVLPGDAAAIAVGAKEVAVLAPAGTRVVRFPELESIFSTKLPAWRAGFFTAGALVIELDGGKTSTGEVSAKQLVIDVGTLEPVALPAPGAKLPAEGAPDRDGGSSSRERAEDREGDRGTEGSPEG